MAKPLTQLIKTLTDSTDEATKAGQATADGFTDDALAEISNQVDLPSGNPDIYKPNQGEANQDAMFDLLSNAGESVNIGAEKGRAKKNGISKFTSPYGSTRYVEYENGVAVSAMQLMSMDGKKAKIANVFTLPEKQKQGKASKLMQKARNDFDKVEHSEDLTKQGAAFANSVERVGQSLPMDEPLKKGIDGLSDKIKSQKGVKTLSLYEDRKGNIKLNSIIIDKEARGEGVGSDVMEQIISYADKEGKQVQLTPALKDDYQGTTSQSRLKKFYKRFGFVENKGRNKDFSISELMYRNPNKIAGVGGGALLIGITPEEAKAAPLEQQMLEAEALDQEGLTADVEYSQLLNEIDKATEQSEWDSIAVNEEPKEKEEAPKAEGKEFNLADVGEGIIEIPLQTVGGIADAVNETLDLTKELGSWLNENVVDLGGVVVDENGISLVSGKEVSEADNVQIPTTDKADSITGGGIRGIAQFAAGFIGAGKLKPIQALKPATTAGKIGKASLQGAIADFTVFDPQEERLSNLASDFGIETAVTDFLAASPDDNAAEGRFKNAVEGLGIGVAVDGLLTGLKILRNARIAKREAQAIEKEAAKENAVESGFGSKQGESFDPEITPEQIQAAIDGFEPKPKDLTEVDVSPEDLINRPNVDVDEGEVFVNWSRIDSPDDVKALMRDMADKMQPEIDEARRGKQSFEQMKLNAEGVDAWETLSNRRQGQPLNAEQSIAARELWARSADNLSKVSKQAALDPTPANLMAFKKMAAVHNQVQREVIAARTETARALASWRIPTGSMKMDEVEQILAMGGGSKGAQMMAQRVADLAEQGMIKEMDAFIEKSAWAKTSDAIKQAFYFSLLSGPKTHLRNIVGATSAIAQQVYERKGANLLGQALGRENVAAGEAMAMVSSLLRGARETFVTSSKGKRVLKESKKLREQGDIVGAEKAIEEAGGEIGTARKYMATGKSGWGTGKVDEAMLGAFDPEVWNVQKESMLGRGLSFINSVTMTPTHALGMMDEIFTTTAYRMEINSQAIRQASNEVADGKITSNQFNARVEEIVDSPQEAVKDNARELAKQVAFTEQPKDTPVWNVLKATGALPYGIGTIIMPFTRTVYNLGRYTFERTPLAPAVKRWREDIQAGGARADLAISKVATGSTIMLAMADLAMSGQITGEGPSDWKQREQLKRTGWQPNSIKVENEDGSTSYYGVRGMEPFSTPIMLASNMVEILKESDIGDEDQAAEAAWVAAIMAVTNQVVSQQYMSGINSFFEMMSDSKRHGQNWTNRLASTVIPTGVAEITKAMDPYARTAYNMGQTIRKRTPGLSKDLPYNTDVWGRPISYRSDIGGLYDALSPVYVSSTSKQEPIDKELNKLEKYISKPSKKVNFKGISINLKKYPKAYEEYVKLSGNELTETKYGAPIDMGGKGLKDTLNDLVTGKHPLSGDYDLRTGGSDGGKAQKIQAIVTKFQQAARDVILEKHFDVQAEYEIKKTKSTQKYDIGL
jgi:predicted GNAT family acetyltransferase